MKVLWFEISTPSRYLNTGQVTLGWQDALENIVATCKDIELYIAFESQVPAEVKVIDGITYIPMITHYSFWENKIGNHTWAINERKVIEQGRKVIEQFKPDVIQFHWANPFPAWVLLCVIPKNVKLIIHWHMDIIKQKHIYPFIKPVETALLKRADMVCVTSPQYRANSLPLQPFKDKVKIVQNAMDEDNFILRDGDVEKINAVKAKYGNKPIVFFIGRHIQYKGLPHLIEAEKYVKSDCVFVIAGSGPLTYELKAQCKSSRVYFVGRLSDEDLKLYHYAASVFAFPSITKNEAFGVALAEAMYCGTPAVTFTIPGSGVNWVSLNGETGIEMPNGDDKAYAEAIDKLIGDKELSKRYAENGMKRVRDNFTIPKMIEEMEKCYRELKG